MRIVHTADWHIGKIINDYSMLEDQKYYFDQFIIDLKELKPDALLISGDLYDRSIPSADAISLLNSILCKIVLELKIKTFIIAGNHDSKERLSFVGDLLEKSGLYIAGNIANEMKCISIQSNTQVANIYMLPYIEPHNVKMIFPDLNPKTHNDAIHFYYEKALNSLDENEINILMAHGLFQCVQSTNEINDEKSVGGSDMVDASLFEPFDYVALGHLHSHRHIGSDKMRYSGSPLKYSIDEAMQSKSYTIVDISDKKNLLISTKEIKPLRDIRVIEGSFEYLSNRHNHQNLNDYVFANITDDTITLHAISILKSIFPNILGLKYINLSTKNIDNTVQSTSSVKQQTETELFANFYHNVSDVSLTSEEMDYVSEVITMLKGEEYDSN